MDMKESKQVDSNVRSAAATGHRAHLPDDVIAGIFLRLPRDSLIRCSLASKSCLRRTSNPSFLLSYESLHPPSIGLFFDSKPLHGPPKFTPIDSCDDVATILHLQILKLYLIGEDADLSLLGSSNGLLLLGNPYCINRRELLVFNPATRKLVIVPPPPENFSHKWGIGFISHSPSALNNSPRFKIILVGGGVTVHTFSDLGQWRTTIASTDDEHINCDLYATSTCRSLTCKPAVFANGFLYWVYGDSSHMRAYDIEMSHLSTIRLPMKATDRDACLGQSEGRLWCAFMGSTHMEVWGLRKDGSSWRLEHRVIRGEMGGWVGYFLVPIGFDCMDRNVVFLWKWRATVYSYHLLKRTLTEICNYGCQKGVRIFPYQMMISPNSSTTSKCP